MNKKLRLAILVLFWVFCISTTTQAAFIEPSVAPSSSDQDFTQNILGANNNNNDFDSSTVVANQDGSLIERLQYIIEAIASLWTKNGNDLYYTTGNIGIGTTTPQYGQLEVKPTAGDSTSGITLNDGTNATARSWIGSGDLWHLTRGSVATNGITINTSGNVGIGTTSPAAKLDVEGTFKLGNMASTSAGTCGSNTFGVMYFDTDENRPYVCASPSTWKPLDSDYDKDGLTDSVDTDDTDSTGGNGLDNLIAANIVSGVTINGVTGTSPDITPENFTFTDQTNVALSTLTESNILQITGISDSVTVISISGDGTPAYRICADGSCSGTPSYTTATSTINNNKYLQLRLTSNASAETANSSTITVGTGNDSWSVTTGNITPTAFEYTDQTDVALSTLTSSNILQITGLTIATAVSISGDGTPAYRICSTSNCDSVTHDWSTSAGSIDNNEYLQLRLTSNASFSTANSATIIVGTGSDSWSVTTERFYNYGNLFIDGETVIEDENGNHTITNNGLVISTNQKKYGISSMYASGGATYLSIPTTNMISWNSPWTVDFWIYLVSTSPGSFMFEHWDGDGERAKVRSYLTSGAIGLNWWYGQTDGTNTGFYPASATVSINNWSHVAITKTGTLVEIFVDGVSKGTSNLTGTIDPLPHAFEIFHGLGGTSPEAYLDNFRITQSVLWTSNFNLTDTELFY